MVTIPAATPVTTPVDDPTVAIAPMLLVHVPPVVESLMVMVEPIHTDDEPVIGLTAKVTVDNSKAINERIKLFLIEKTILVVNEY
jgi:hypothetical protein